MGVSFGAVHASERHAKQSASASRKNSHGLASAPDESRASKWKRDTGNIIPASRNSYEELMNAAAHGITIGRPASLTKNARRNAVPQPDETIRS
ncbi:MAG TPA: hypothetical protein IAA95_02330 [Candidatus Aveggerthella excrementigallinarum]|nr:hypothetical protein [Candidatus Aveggerthella excrementigallinarum]